jgi:hypothetical protein
MNVLLIGACGYMGPHVARELAPHHRLRITDVAPAPEDLRRDLAGHEFFDLDVTGAAAVHKAAEGMDAIVNFAVVRSDPVLAFRVNTLGCLHVMRAAAAHGIRRVINTGPHFTVAGPTYEGFDHAIVPDVPPHPGTGLYPLSKSLGHEICRLFTASHDVYVQEYLFYILRDPAELRAAAGGVPFVISWADAARAFRLGIEVDLARLPSKCEVFFFLADLPQAKFLGEKAKRVLGFAPKDDLTVLWTRPD